MTTITFSKEDIVSSEVAKLLNKNGFKDWCGQCYTTAVMHNGKPIDFDEECELKSEGYGHEIEYIDGGVLFNGGYANKEDFGAYAAPSLAHAVKWLEENGYILYVYPVHREKICWMFEIWFDKVLLNDYKMYNTREEATDAGIKYCLEKLF